MSDEELHLLQRLRVLESITSRIRAAEQGLCAVVEWKPLDLHAGQVTVCEMIIAD